LTIDISLNHELWAQKAFPGVQPLQFEALEGDASDRRYVRLKRGEESRLLLIGPNRQENILWLYLGRQLWYHGLPLPQIYKSNLEKGLFVLEDLGPLRLDGFSERRSNEQEPEQNRLPEQKQLLEQSQLPEQTQLLEQKKLLELRRDAYRKTIAALVCWRQKALSAAEGLGVQNPPYDLDMITRLEWGYFLKGLELIGVKANLNSDFHLEGKSLCQAASDYGEKVLIHRDFQSRNIIIKEGDPYIIDWQGARVGPASYDLASLLYDPYVTLDDEFKLELIDLYLNSLTKPLDKELFFKEFRLHAVMRLMQATGAYAHLWKVKKLPRYGRFLHPALTRLFELFSSFPQYPIVRSVIHSAALFSMEITCAQ
jgi:aminoglycoside/choline kinase family phosphotransferase